jgi:putative endonuclease
MGALAATWLNLQEWTVDHLRSRPIVPHLRTGLLGERAALFHLRRAGYTVVATRWKTIRLRGDVDLIAWHGDTLCFIEVKTRTARDLSPAESAVDRDKQQMLRRHARAYLRAFPEEPRRRIPVRFDVVSVYLLGDCPEIQHLEGAFAWH